jgi:hypothetical protein
VPEVLGGHHELGISLRRFSKIKKFWANIIYQHQYRMEYALMAFSVGCCFSCYGYAYIKYAKMAQRTCCDTEERPALSQSIIP